MPESVEAENTYADPRARFLTIPFKTEADVDSISASRAVFLARIQESFSEVEVE